MPIVHIYLTPALEDEDKKLQLFKSVTEAISTTLNKDPGLTRILLHELPVTDWSVAGTSVKERSKESEKKLNSHKSPELSSKIDTISAGDGESK